jgi:hypothetical protein
VNLVIGNGNIVTVLQPNGGEALKGGGIYDIKWVWNYAGGNPLFADIYYDTAGGGGSYPNKITDKVVGDATNPEVWTWNPVDSIDSDTCRVKVVLFEKIGANYNEIGNDTSDANFKIDSIPPTIINTDPVDDQGNVSILTTITIWFSEEMNQSSAESEFSISPLVSGSFTWNSGDIMVFTPG